MLSRFSYPVIGAISLGLVGCGGGSSSFTAPTNDGLNGITITSSNINDIFTNAISRTAQVNVDILDADTSDLSISSTDGNVVTLNCPISGTVAGTEISESGQVLEFTNCVFPGPVTYNNTARISVTGTGLDDYPNTLADWNLTETISFTNFTMTESGITTVANGDAVVTESNNTSTFIQHTRMTSSNLKYDLTDSTNTTMSVQYSSLVYDFTGHTDTDYSEVDYDFTANISPDIGVIQLAIGPTLAFDNNGLLLSGSAVATTGNSTVKMEAQGNDNVDILIDPENDGTFEAAIQTTWSDLNN